MVFGGLAPLVIEQVEDVGDQIVVRASTPLVAVACPDCGVPTARVHGLYERTVGDVPVDARRVQMVVRVRRLVCPTFGCRRTFLEQAPGVLHRHQRRTVRLQALVGAVARELAGRGAARLLSKLAVPLSRDSTVRALLRMPLDFAMAQLSAAGPVPPTCCCGGQPVDVLAFPRGQAVGGRPVSPIRRGRVGVRGLAAELGALRCLARMVYVSPAACTAGVLHGGPATGRGSRP